MAVSRELGSGTSPSFGGVIGNTPGIRGNSFKVGFSGPAVNFDVSDVEFYIKRISFLKNITNHIHITFIFCLNLN